MGDLGSVEKLKHQISQILNDPVHSLHDMYNTDGVCQMIVQNQRFQEFMKMVSFLNMIWIAIEIDRNQAVVLCNAPVLIQVIENVFTCYFLVELLIRFLAFREKWQALLMFDTWLLYDGCLVIHMVWETWISVIVYLSFAGVNELGP